MAPAQRQLKAILNEPAFAEKMREASAWEQWKQQVYDWLGKHFAKFFESIVRHPTTSKVVFWTFLVGAFGFICYQLFRLFRRGERLLPDRVTPEPTAEVEVNWIRAAKTSAEGGDLNKAIQCTYWAGVSRLQTDGVLPKAGSHTPREFLDVVGSGNAAVPLRSLTSSLERFWYARMPARNEDFVAVLKTAEALGCKLD